MVSRALDEWKAQSMYHTAYQMFWPKGIANSQRPDRDTIFVLEPDLMIAIADHRLPATTGSRSFAMIYQELFTHR
jgi:hypothetical protein